MKTSVAAGCAIPGDDPDIVKALLAASNVSGTLNRASGLHWQVGVRNAEGEIYRTTIFTTRSQLMRLALRMERIGYVDELGGVQGPLEGFEAIYSRAAPLRAQVRAPARAGVSAWPA